MATILSYTPSSVIDKAMFNFDAMGGTDFKLSGPISVSVSEPFIYSQYLNGFGNNFAWTPDVASVYWNATQISNINSVLNVYKQFAQFDFSTVKDLTTYSPLGVGLLGLSDINLTLLNRTDLKFAGISSLNQNSFDYTGSQLDIELNVTSFGSTDYTLSSTTYGGHALMHELGHSLGLSHPHSAITNGVATLSADFAATKDLGFSKLGFVLNSAADMNKEYFTIMSYDDQVPYNSVDTYAQTPMILDVIALQDAYGAGSGSTSTGDDTITPGGSGGVDSYRTYFDTGGTDTINLTNYVNGAYINLGTTIQGASHLVGVTMSLADEKLMVSGLAPKSLRWLYGEFENANGTSSSDLITGNDLANTINTNQGNDVLTGLGGNDVLDGGDGIDTAYYQGTSLQYSINLSKSTITDTISTRDGIDSLANIERLHFTDVSTALDFQSGGHAGQAYRLYKGVLGREGEPGGLGYVINRLDQGEALKLVASGYLNSPEFQVKYGNADQATFINLLYKNILGRAADLGGTSFINNWIAGGATREDVTLGFTESPEYISQCATLIGNNGIHYTPVIG